MTREHPQARRRKAEQQALWPFQLQLNHCHTCATNSCPYTEEIQDQISLLSEDEEEAGPSQQEEEAGPQIITQQPSLVSCKIREKISAAIWGRLWQPGCSDRILWSTIWNQIIGKPSNWDPCPGMWALTRGLGRGQKLSSAGDFCQA